MKRCTLLLTLLVSAMAAMAQGRIATYSRDSVLSAMPDYRQAQSDLRQLRSQYDEEMRRAETEFNAKYEEFLDALPSLAPSIRRKRQSEFQQSLSANVTFRNEARRLLRQAEQDAMLPLGQKVDAAVSAIAAGRGYLAVLNTDAGAVTYVSPALADDITAEIADKLKNSN